MPIRITSRGASAAVAALCDPWRVYFCGRIGNVPDRFSNESRGLNAERTSTRERPREGHGGLRGKRTGYIEIKGSVISPSPLRWLGPTQITELASASATGPSSRELTLNTAATRLRSVLSHPSALPDSLRSGEESPFLWKIAEKLRARVRPKYAGIAAGFRYRIESTPRARFAFGKKWTNCFLVFFFFTSKHFINHIEKK